MLSIISAKNRTFAHIQPITFPFLIPSSACFLYSVPHRQAHLCDPVGSPGRRHHDGAEGAGAYLRQDHADLFGGAFRHHRPRPEEHTKT